MEGDDPKYWDFIRESSVRQPAKVRRRKGDAEEALAARLAFPVMLATEGDHLKAADPSNLAAREGVALSTPDALIAAQAFNRRASLFTKDGEFPKLAALTRLKLF